MKLPFQKPVKLPPQKPDDPTAFGFKNSWWAVPSTNTQAVVEAIRLQDPQPANWQTGIKYSYKGSVFVTPPVGDWTLIVGLYLRPMGDNARDEVIQPLLELSRTFGTALVFATHRIVDYHVWAKAVSGSLVRGFGYVGESGRTIWDEGEITPEEERSGFDLPYVDEMNVMQIAREWSVAPNDLEEYRPKERSLGVLGSQSELLKHDFAT